MHRQERTCIRVSNRLIIPTYEYQELSAYTDILPKHNTRSESKPNQSIRTKLYFAIPKKPGTIIRANLRFWGGFRALITRIVLLGDLQKKH